jgi:hypothetical protein
MELREILSNVDKTKLTRGAIVMLLATITLALAIAWAVFLLS